MWCHDQCSEFRPTVPCIQLAPLLLVLTSHPSHRKSVSVSIFSLLFLLCRLCCPHQVLSVSILHTLLPAITTYGIQQQLTNLPTYQLSV